MTDLQAYGLLVAIVLAAIYAGVDAARGFQSENDDDGGGSQ